MPVCTVHCVNEPMHRTCPPARRIFGMVKVTEHVRVTLSSVTELELIQESPSCWKCTARWRATN
eukprot:83447-Rhodomonas_salina.1